MVCVAAAVLIGRSGDVFGGETNALTGLDARGAVNIADAGRVRTRIPTAS